MVSWMLLWPAMAHARDCGSLSRLAGQELARTSIDLAASVPAGDFAPDGDPAHALSVPAFCRVTGVISPSVRFEVWLPDHWNGKFVMAGEGGTAGYINYRDMRLAIAAGYATASTDTGHLGSDSSWMGKPDLLTAYFHTAVHDVAVRAKAMIAARYDRPPVKSYYNSCSNGGRQGLMEALRYPDDFDGVVAGAPVMYLSRAFTLNFWLARSAIPDGQTVVLTPEALGILHRAVTAACDPRDGVADGVIENPASCRFDPGSLRCKPGRGGQCLTDAQVTAARAIYGGPRNPRTGAAIYPGPSLGSELDWSSVWERYLGGGSTSAGVSLMRNLFHGPDWLWSQFDFDTDQALLSERFAAADAIDPNLDAFRRRGGRIIIYHGWGDGSVAPAYSLRYRYAVAAHIARDPTARKTAMDDFMRVFMVPGMKHCSGGIGTDKFDMTEPLDRWVSRGEAPTRIIASRVVDGRVVRTRPLCAWPRVARWTGKGSSDAAGSFVCSAPLRRPDT
ncbi:MAG: tannase/feruloyl esterase family alpha/beta hydrolase [Phenylobacterium sp.]|nr:tannase/feruloyl esterase family alpha/beta hydrolase [Phenylobacterium sp.]